MSRGVFSSTSNNLMSATSGGSPITSYPFTFGCWFFRSGSTTTQTIFSFCDSASASARNGLYVGTASGFQLHEFLNNSQGALGSALPTSSWIHVVWSCTSSTDRFVCIDGTVTTTSASKSVGASPDRWSIGQFCDSTPSSPGLDLFMSNATIWNVALTQAEAIQLFDTRMDGTLMRPQDLVAHAPMNDGIGNARELIGGRNLIETGAVGLTNDSYGITRRPQHFYFPGVAVGGASFTLDIDPGSYTYSGVNVALEHDQTLALDAGSYSYGGVNVALEHNQTLVLDAGSYTYSGVDVALEHDQTLVIAAGSYTYSGVDVSLEYGGVDPVINLDVGSYTYSGADVALEHDQTLTLDAGSYTYSGADVALEHDQTLVIAAGSYAYGGVDVALEYDANLVLVLDAGAYTTAGINVALEYSGSLAVLGPHTAEVIGDALSATFIQTQELTSDVQ